MKAAIFFIGRFIAAWLGGVVIGIVAGSLIQWMQGTKDATISSDTISGLATGFGYMMFALMMDKGRYAPTSFMIAGLLWLFANVAIGFGLAQYGHVNLAAFPWRVMINQGFGIIVAAWIGIRARERAHAKQDSATPSH